ncbi:MAG: helix-turn-helix domain-containing protein [Phycisphaerae bacterium]|nr:helix-turn-helix domain-containing protein [Phycisphaerae bacterium]
MMNRKSNSLVRALSELQGYARDDLTLRDLKGRLPTRVRIIAPQPRSYSAAAIKKLRTRLGVSQADFAGLLGVSRILVQSWERGVRDPSPLASRLLDTIERDPEAWLAALVPAPTKSRRAS